jgi:7-cyano-7-deazaguanine reductase
MSPTESNLGKKTEYDTHYNPDKLFPISRKINRNQMLIPEVLPFFGYDLWNHYEVSWLNQKGKPIAGIAQILYACDSPNIIESKSMKLYFNSFNNTRMENIEMLQSVIKSDLESRIESPVSIKVSALNQVNNALYYRGMHGKCIDDIDIECTDYTINPSYLYTDTETVKEVLYSDLLKSNCLVTNQPDWGSLQISYQGLKINHAGLLRYIISFRHSNDFSEQCIERIFMDIMQFCKPEQLTVYGRFTRRGGLDINPYRSTEKCIPEDSNVRLCRQ